MKMKTMTILILILLAVPLSGCAGKVGTVNELPAPASTAALPEHIPVEPVTGSTKIADVINDPLLGDCGRLLFPTDSGYYSGDTLSELRLVWYSNIDPDETVEIVNYVRGRAAAGETVFYDIYTEEEKAADPAKRDTGLFFFKGTPGGASPCAMPEAALPTSVRCRTASRMRWSCQSSGTTPSR